MGQVEGLRLFVFVCEHDDHAEVGEVIGHVFPFVDGLLICGVDGESNRAQSVKIEPWRCGFLCWLPGLAGLVFVDPLPQSHLVLRFFPTRGILQCRLDQVVGELGHWNPPGLGFMIQGADKET